MADMETQSARNHQEALRLNRYLALAGVGSRRKNDELILSGAVRVNGRVVKELGTRIDPSRDRVSVNGKAVQPATKYVYILFNKPRDCITTLSDEKGRTSVLDYVKVRQRVVPVGRLDRNTTGVLLLTNDGELTHALTHPAFGVTKEYQVRLDKGLTEEAVRRMRKGVRLEDGMARAEAMREVPGTHRTEVLIVVGEGRNRMVRRMFEALGYTVKRLERVAFAGMTSAGLGRGKWRHLSSREIAHLRTAAGLDPAPFLSAWSD